jgi:hypothetical protein
MGTHDRTRIQQTRLNHTNCNYRRVHHGIARDDYPFTGRLHLLDSPASIGDGGSTPVSAYPAREGTFSASVSADLRARSRAGRAVPRFPVRVPQKVLCATLRKFIRVAAARLGFTATIKPVGRCQSTMT